MTMTPSRRDFITLTGAALAGIATLDAAQTPSPGGFGCRTQV